MKSFHVGTIHAGTLDQERMGFLVTMGALGCSDLEYKGCITEDDSSES